MMNVPETGVRRRLQSLRLSIKRAGRGRQLETAPINYRVDGKQHVIIAIVQSPESSMIEAEVLMTVRDSVHQLVDAFRKNAWGKLSTTWPSSTIRTKSVVKPALPSKRAWTTSAAVVS